jgi:hypothetical protein
MGYSENNLNVSIASGYLKVVEVKNPNFAIRKTWD